MKPLFIPLRREWFDAFAAGIKTEEWRRHDARWNERTCAIGQEVILSLGYTRARLLGRVVSFDVRPATGPAADIYGAGTPCAVIGITLRSIVQHPRAA
jgi:hypothetical protein